MELEKLKKELNIPIDKASSKIATRKEILYYMENYQVNKFNTTSVKKLNMPINKIEVFVSHND